MKISLLKVSSAVKNKRTLQILPLLLISTSSCKNQTGSESQLEMSGLEVKQLAKSPGVEGVVSIFNQDKEFKCTGALIAVDRVLTAGHCVMNANKIYVNLNKSLQDRQLVEAIVEKVHPYLYKEADFTLDGDLTTSMLNDLQILKLQMPVNENQQTKVVKLSSNPSMIGQKVYLYGYGDGKLILPHQLDMQDDPLRLLKGAVGEVYGRPRLGTKEKFLKNSDFNMFSEAQKLIGVQLDLLANPEGKTAQPSSCVGDSGGSVFNEKGEIVGVAVTVPDKILMRGFNPPRETLEPNCKAGYTYMMDIAYFKEWIEDTQSNHVELKNFPDEKIMDKVATGPMTKWFATNLKVTNKSNKVIDAMYVAADYATSWSFNMIREKLLQSGESVNIRIDDKTCFYELKMNLKKNENESMEERTIKVDICKSSVVYIED